METEREDRPRERESSGSLRTRDDRIESARHSLVERFIDARRCYVINEERRRSHREAIMNKSKIFFVERIIVLPRVLE